VFEPGIVYFQANGRARQPPASDIVALPDISLAGKVFEIAHLDGTPIPEPPPRPFFGWHGDRFGVTVTRNDVLNKFHALKAQR
jgi:hypothetical protein